MPRENTVTDLALLLKANGWTQAKLAAALDVTQAAVSYWVSGRTPLPAVRAAEIETFLGAEPGTLAHESGTMETAATTRFAYLVDTDTRPAWLGMPRIERLKAIHQGLKESGLNVPPADYRRWYYRAQMTSEVAAQIQSMYWPGVERDFLQRESVVLVRKRELEAVNDFADEVLAEATSWAEVAKTLKEHRDEFDVPAIALVEVTSEPGRFEEAYQKWIA